jgi:hypothetical protein
MAKLEAKVLKRHAGILELATGSTHAGEQLNGLRLAAQLLNTHKSRWIDVLMPEVVPAPAPPPPPLVKKSHYDTCRECLVVADGLLDQREEEFLSSLLTRSYPLSEKQIAWIHRICNKIGVIAWDRNPLMNFPNLDFPD